MRRDAHQLRVEEKHCREQAEALEKEVSTTVQIWPSFQLNVKSPPVGGLLIFTRPTPSSEFRLNFDRKGDTNTAATIIRSEAMYDYDDIVTAVTSRINGLATQDVLSHIHNVFSDKIAASGRIEETGKRALVAALTPGTLG